MQWWCSAQNVAWEWTWQPYPGVWAFVAAIGAAYLSAVRRAAHGARAEARTKHAAAFAAGVFLLWVALDWPVGALGAGYLASVHMVQFLLMAVIAPPLLLLGTPRQVYARLEETPWCRGWLSAGTHPLVTLAAFNLVVAVTHWPAVVDTLMPTQLGSFVIDLAWLVAGLGLWWPVVAPVPQRSWLGYPAKMGYLVANTMVSTGFFLYLTFSEFPRYATYELAPPVSGISARTDQQVAGFLMKLGGGLVLWTAISILFFRWYRASEAGGSGSAAQGFPGAPGHTSARGVAADMHPRSVPRSAPPPPQPGRPSALPEGRSGRAHPRPRLR